MKPYRLERVRRQFEKRQGIPSEYNFVVWNRRYNAHDSNLFEIPPKWEEEWHPLEEIGLGEYFT